MFAVKVPHIRVVFQVPETLVDPTIFGDSVKLFDHQHKAVSWMLYIESLPGKT